MTQTNPKLKVMVENISCVLPQQQNLGGLFVGNVYGAQNPAILKQYGIRAVLTSSIQTNINYISTDIPFHIKIQAHDKQNYNLREHLNKCIHFIEETRKFTNVYVHCYAGVSRSIAIVCAYIMWKFKWNYETTIAFVKAKRIVAKPNDGFVKQLIEIQQILLETSYRNRKQVIDKQQFNHESSLSNNKEKPNLSDQTRYKNEPKSILASKNIQIKDIHLAEEYSKSNQSKSTLSRQQTEHQLNVEEIKKIQINQVLAYKAYQKSKPISKQLLIQNPLNKQALKNTFYELGQNPNNQPYLQNYSLRNRAFKSYEKHQMQSQKSFQKQINHSNALNLRGGVTENDIKFTRTDRHFYKTPNYDQLQDESGNVSNKNLSNLSNDPKGIGHHQNSVNTYKTSLNSYQNSSNTYQNSLNSSQSIMGHTFNGNSSLKSARREQNKEGIILGGKRLYNHNNIPIPKVSQCKQLNIQGLNHGKAGHGSTTIINQIYKNKMYNEGNQFLQSQSRQLKNNKFSLTSPNKFVVGTKYSITEMQSPRTNNIYDKKNDFRSSAPTQGFFNSKMSPLNKQAQKSTSRCLVRPKDLPGYNKNF